MWFESLLDYNQKDQSTWGQWAERLVAQYQPCKRLGAQVGVGWMRTYPPGTVSHKLMPYAILFSGYKWIGATDREESLGEGWKCWRYAMRFSEYFYNRAFSAVCSQRIGNDIALLHDVGALWKPWVFESTSKQGRDILIGILNVAGDKPVAERSAIPDPLTGLTLRLTLADGERISTCSLLSSEPFPRALPLKIGTDGTVTLPTIDWAAAVIVHIEKN